MESKKLDDSTLFKIIRIELNKMDPLKVLLDNTDADSLEDEYDLENREIIPFVKSQIDYKKLADKICKIFIETTTMKFYVEEFYECAKNILEKIKGL